MYLVETGFEPLTCVQIWCTDSFHLPSLREQEEDHRTAAGEQEVRTGHQFWFDQSILQTAGEMHAKS
jgi:hypothetical protein